jgi:hypothetical protein
MAAVHPGHRLWADTEGEEGGEDSMFIEGMMV